MKLQLLPVIELLPCLTHMDELISSSQQPCGVCSVTHLQMKLRFC